MDTKLPPATSKTLTVDADSPPHLAAPTLPQAQNGILDLINIGSEGVKVKIGEYGGRRDGDQITAHFGDLRQVKMVDKTNLDYPAYLLSFPVADIKVGRYEVGYEVKSLMGVVTPSDTISVEVINGGTPPNPPGDNGIQWTATSGAPNLVDNYSNQYIANLISVQADPSHVLVISDISPGAEVGSGTVPRPGSSFQVDVYLDNLGRATLWIMRKAGTSGDKATFTLTDREDSTKVAHVSVTFGSWKSAGNVPFNIANTTGAPADGTTPCSIYMTNMSSQTKQVTVRSSDGRASIVGNSTFNVEANWNWGVQVTSNSPGDATITIESDGVAFSPVVLNFIKP